MLLRPLTLKTMPREVYDMRIDKTTTQSNSLVEFIRSANFFVEGQAEESGESRR